MAEKVLEIRFTPAVEGTDIIDRLYNLMHMPWQANWCDDEVTMTNMEDSSEILAVIREVDS